MPDQRGKGGKFLPGNQMAKGTTTPGGINREKAFRYSKRFYTRVSLKDWGDIVDRAVLDAKGQKEIIHIYIDDDGEEIDREVIQEFKKADPRARDFIAYYAIGKPQERITIDHNIEVEVNDDPRDRILGKVEELRNSVIEGSYNIVQSRNGTDEHSTSIEPSSN